MSAKKDLISLASAIANGYTVRRWADETGTSRRAAYTWSRSPECRKLVEEIRRRAIDRAIGKLVSRAAGAADRITDLSKDAMSEQVRLAASRAILSDLIAVENHADLKKRLTEIERRLNEHSDNPGIN